MREREKKSDSFFFVEGGQVEQGGQDKGKGKSRGEGMGVGAGRGAGAKDNNKN